MDSLSSEDFFKEDSDSQDLFELFRYVNDNVAK